MKIKCYKCGKIFEDMNYTKKYKSVIRLYCKECIDEMWEKQKNEN